MAVIPGPTIPADLVPDVSYDTPNTKANDVETPIGTHQLVKQKTHFTELAPEKTDKVITCTSIFIVMSAILICAMIIPIKNGYHLIVVQMSFGSIVWIIQIFRCINSFTHLHYVRIKRRRAPNADFVFIPYGFEERRNVPMTSISQIVAMRGSNTERIHAVFYFVTFGMLYSVICIKWAEIANGYGGASQMIELTLFTISIFGFFMSNLWELEEKSRLSNTMHYIHSMLCFFIGPLPFCIHQKWSVISIIVLCSAYTGMAGWLCLLEWIQRKEFGNEENDLADVHRYSKISLLSELFAGSICISSYLFYVYCLGTDAIL
eukprot:83002_1